MVKIKKYFLKHYLTLKQNLLFKNYLLKKAIFRSNKKKTYPN